MHSSIHLKVLLVEFKIVKGPYNEDSAHVCTVCRWKANYEREDATSLGTMADGSHDLFLMGHNCVSCILVWFMNTDHCKVSKNLSWSQLVAVSQDTKYMLERLMIDDFL